MTFTLNGQPKSFETPITVAELLEKLQINADRVAVERNRAILPREAFGTTVLADGDSIEVVQFVGGG